MSNVVVNGIPVVKARIARPRVGNWVAELIVAAETVQQLSGGSRATILTDTNAPSGGLSFTGTVMQGRSDTYVQTASLRVVGGSGGLGTKCNPRFYSSVSVASPLGDVLMDAGETLSSLSNSTGPQLQFWTIAAQPASEQLSLLAQAADQKAVWRVLKDGSVFFGVDAFNPTLMTDFELIDYSPLEAFQVLTSEDPTLNPGESIDGRNVSVVVHLFEADKSRMKVWFEQ
jgi:hypothetical protein